MPEVVVAVVIPECFETIRTEGFYGAGFRPGNPWRCVWNDEVTENLAFYITAPTKAITHYARVINTVVGVPHNDPQIPEYYRRDPPWIYKAYHIELPLIELPRPIIHDGHMRMGFGRRSTTLDRLLNPHTRTVSDLFRR